MKSTFSRIIVGFFTAELQLELLIVEFLHHEGRYIFEALEADWHLNFFSATTLLILTEFPKLTVLNFLICKMGIRIVPIRTCASGYMPKSGIAGSS